MRERFLEMIRAHAWVIALALLASFLVALPQIYFRIEHRSDGIYQGIELLPDSPWSPRVREVMDGHPNFGAIYYKDGKDDPYLFQPLGTQVVAYMGQALGLDINNTLLLSRLVMTFAVFLLIYGFVYALSRDKRAALTATTALLLAESAMSLHGVKEILHGISPDNFLHIAKPVNHAMFFVFLFSFLISFWKFYKDKWWVWGAVSTVLLGLNFYNYFYSWTYLYAVGGILGLSLLLRKQWAEAARIACVFVGALILAIPWGLNLYHASQFASYAEVGRRFGLLETHMPIFIGFVALAALVAYLLWFPKEDRERYWFGLAIMLAPLVTMNQQILTGKAMQAGHYHWYFHKPMAVIFGIIIVFALLSRFGWGAYKKWVAMAVIAASFAVGTFVQMASYHHTMPGRDGGTTAVERQQYGPALRWLAANAPKESVVFANDEVSHLTTIYTPLNVFHHRAAAHSLVATDQRLRDVVFTYYRLRGVTAKDARAVFFAEREYLSTNLYVLYYRDLLGSSGHIPDEVVEELVEYYTDSWQESPVQWLTRVWRQYEVAYVVWDKSADPLWQLNKYRFLKEEAAFGDVVVYRFNP